VKIDSETGKEMITRRFATVEPVFGNLRGNKRAPLYATRKSQGGWPVEVVLHDA
jgi:hypothetical protein